MGQEVKIEDVRLMPTTDPGRVGKKDTVITYRIGQGRPRTVTLPNEKPRATDVQTAIRAQESTASAMIGSSFTL
jgi:hypothetical protein